MDLPLRIDRSATDEQTTQQDLADPLLQLLRRDLDRAYRMAGLLLADASEAEDAVGDAIERAWRARQQFRGDRAFGPWFDRILLNICRDRLRRRRRIRWVTLPGDFDQAAAFDAFGAFFERDAATRALASLSPDERIVIVLHFWADLTLAAIATRLRCPVGTVKSRLNRALTVLRSEARAIDRLTP